MDCPGTAPALLPRPSLAVRRTCGALGGPLGVLSFVFGRWLWRTVGFSVGGASLSLLFVLPIGELPLRLSRALVNIEIASMLPRSQEREGGFSFPSPPLTLQGGPAHDSSALSQGRPSCSRAAALPHTTNNFEDRGREARADSLKAICYRWLRDRRPEPPAPREGRAGNAGDVSLTLGLSARPWLKVALREEAPGNSPMEGSGCPPTPWCVEFFMILLVSNTQ